MKNGELTDIETRVFESLINPKYPLGVRSFRGIFGETGINPKDLLLVLLSPVHSIYLARHGDLFRLRFKTFILLHPTFQKHALN